MTYAPSYAWRGTQSTTLGGHSGQSHFAVDPQERRARWVRWGQTQEGSKTHMAVDALGDLLARLVLDTNFPFIRLIKAYLCS